MKKFIMCALAVAMFTASTGYSAESKYDSMTTPQLQSELKNLEKQAGILIKKEILIDSYLNNDSNIFFKAEKHASKVIAGGLGGAILSYVLIKKYRQNTLAVVTGVTVGTSGLVTAEFGVLTKVINDVDPEEFIQALDTLSRKEVIGLKSIINEQQSENYRNQVIVEDLLGL